jgi:hypothetical protein
MVPPATVMAPEGLSATMPPLLAPSVLSVPLAIAMSPLLVRTSIPMMSSPCALICRLVTLTFPVALSAPIPTPLTSVRVRLGRDRTVIVPEVTLIWPAPFASPTSMPTARLPVASIVPPALTVILLRVVAPMPRA